MTVTSPPPTEDVGRSRAHALLNSGVIIVVVIVVASAAASLTKTAAHDRCHDVEHEVVIAENAFHARVGAFTDVPGLDFSGDLAESTWPYVRVRLVGPPGAASSYSIVPDAFC